MQEKAVEHLLYGIIQNVIIELWRGVHVWERM